MDRSRNRQSAWRPSGSIPWLIAATLAACGHPAAPDAGAARDAGPALFAPTDAGSDGLRQDGSVDRIEAGAPDAGARTEAEPADPLQPYRADIRALRALLNGRLPTDIDPQALFEVDLLDAEARAARITALEARMRRGQPSASTEITDAGATLDGATLDGATLDGATLDGAMLDAGLWDAGSAAPRTASRDGGERAQDGGPAHDAGETSVDGGMGPSGENTSAHPLAELKALELERDRLRLRFLRLPDQERTQIIEAVRARRRITIELQASQVDAQRASLDAQRATEASDDLFDRAADSPDAMESALLSERARIETARAELARSEVRLARRRQAEARAGAERLQRIHRYQSRVATIPPAGADTLYDEVTRRLLGEREDLRNAMDRLRDEPDLPRFELSIDLSSYPEQMRAELREDTESLDHDARAVSDEERRLRWTWAERSAEDVRELDQIRVSLLPHMSPRRRAAVLGLGAEGREQLAQELDQITTMARWWALQSWHDLASYPISFVAIAASPDTRFELALAVLLCLFIAFTWRQRKTITDRLGAAVHNRRSTSRWTALARPFWVVLGPLVVPVLLLIALHSLATLLDQLSDALFFQALRIIVLRLSWFYVLVTLATRFLVSRLRYRAGRAAIAKRILGSVRLAMGFGLAAILITDLSELLVGRGYIYGLVVDLAWVGALPIALILLHRWKDDVCEAHRSRWAEGFVARALASSDTTVRRHLLVPPAVVQLAVTGASATLKELALRFEQLRRAFAFLFRRRLERRVETTVGESYVEALPPSIRRAFSELPTDPDLEINRFPRLDEITERVTHALDPDEAGLVLALVGERGIGKTTWLRALERRIDARVDRLDVPHRLTDAEAVCRWLSERLDLPKADSVDELAEVLSSLDEPRVVILDHCQNLVVRAIGGTEGLEALLSLTAKSGRNVVWICAFARFTWRYLERVRQGQDLFQEHIVLEPWSDDDITRLIHHRMQRAGQRASFRDLVVDPLAGTALNDAVLQTEGEYLRLLWDFSSGNPRVAMHFWKHSLVEADSGLRVRLFAAPDVDRLDALHDQSRFLLATIALHENATAEEAAASAGSSVRECSALLAYLNSCGYVRVDEEGHWRLSTHWYRGVVRHLRRQRLLFD